MVTFLLKMIPGNKIGANMIPCAIPDVCFGTLVAVAAAL